jgi:hypothetical protein
MNNDLLLGILAFGIPLGLAALCVLMVVIG